MIVNELTEDKLQQIENNMFITLAYKIYNAYHNPNIEDFKPLFRKTKSVNLDLYNQLIKADALIDEISADTIDFWLLYDLGSYIKLMEKVFLMKNDESSIICCDSILEDKNSRVLIINNDDIVIRIVTELQDHSINIEVSRNFGKQMKNTFKFTNGEINLKYNSDKMLLDHVFGIISKSIKKLLFKSLLRYTINNHIDNFDTLIKNYYMYLYKFNWEGSRIFDYKKEYKDIQWLIKHKYIQNQF